MPPDWLYIYLNDSKQFEVENFFGCLYYKEQSYAAIVIWDLELRFCVLIILQGIIILAKMFVFFLLHLTFKTCIAPWVGGSVG